MGLDLAGGVSPVTEKITLPVALAVLGGIVSVGGITLGGIVPDSSSAISRAISHPCP